ncbi:MAG: DUF481 domain-containing protein [Endozoicomonas sp.]
MSRLPMMAAGLFCCMFPFTSLMADSVLLHNGNEISGKIVSIKDDKLQLDTGYGKLDIPLRDIVVMESDQPLWIRVKGEEAFGRWKLDHAEDQQQLVNEDTGESIKADPSHLARLSDKQPDGDEWRWSGNANVYMNIERGNDKKDNFNADGRIGVRDRLNRHIFDWKSGQERTDDKTTKDNWLLKYGYNRFLSSSWYLVGKGSWEKDKIKSLDSRATVGAGLGHQFWEEPECNLRAELGLSQIWEEYSQPDEKRENLAGHWALHYDQLFWSDVTFYHDQDIYRRFKTNSWLFQTATGFRFKLTDLLQMSLRFEFDYDDDPQPGKKKDDSALLLGLGASW